MNTTIGRRVAVIAAIALSFGVCLAPRSAFTQEFPLILTEDPWLYLRGTEEPPDDWMTLDFDDRDWEEGRTPIGYGETYVNTVIDDMRQVAGGNPGFPSLYTRFWFSLRDPENITKLRLRIRYDDGFVCYINGVEAARAGMPGTAGTPVPFDAAATNRATEAEYQDINITSCEVFEALFDGENVIAIQVNNTNLTSSDCVVDPELYSDDVAVDLCPTQFTCEDLGEQRVRVRWRRPTGVTYDQVELYRNGELTEEQPRTTSLSFTDDNPDLGENVYKIVVGRCGTVCDDEGLTTCTVLVAGGADRVFRRGDANTDGGVNLSDAIVVLGHLFQGQAAPSCLDSADMNDDGSVNLSDPIFLLGSLFQGGDAPPAPGPDDCGPDGTDDDGLADCEYPAEC